MDQHHYLSTDFPEDLKQLIKQKQDTVKEFKGHQLNLRTEREKLKTTYDELVSKIHHGRVNESEKADLSVQLFNSMSQLKIVNLTLTDCDKKLWEALHEFTSLMNTDMHLDVKHGLAIDLD